MAFNLSRAKDVAEREDEGTDVIVKSEIGVPETYVDERGQTQPSVIVMAGKHSRRYRRKKAEQDGRRMKPHALTEGKWTADAMELAVACVISWRGIEDTVNGETVPIPLNPVNAEAVFRAAPWVYDACVEAMEETARFLKPGSPQPPIISALPQD